MRMHAVTDTVSYFADPTTHDLLRALFGEQDARHWQDEALCAQVDGDMWFECRLLMEAARFYNLRRVAEVACDKSGFLSGHG